MSLRWHQKKAHKNSFRFCRRRASKPGEEAEQDFSVRAKVPCLSRLVASCHSLSTRRYLVILYDIFQDQGNKPFGKTQTGHDRPKRIITYVGEQINACIMPESIAKPWPCLVFYICIVASCFTFHRYVPIRSDLLHHIVALSSASFADRRAKRSQHRLFPVTRNHRWGDPSSHEESQHVNSQVERHMRHACSMHQYGIKRMKRMIRMLNYVEQMLIGCFQKVKPFEVLKCGVREAASWPHWQMVLLGLITARIMR